MENEKFLQHHGIKGQSWGVRNGPPYPLEKSSKETTSSKGGNATSKKLKTAASKVKTALSKNVSTSLKDAQENKATKSELKNYKSITKKSTSQMTDSELKTATERLKLEANYLEQYNKVYGTNKNTIASAAGKTASKIIDSAIEDIGKQAASYALGTAVNTLGTKIGVSDTIVDPKLAQKKKK